MPQTFPRPQIAVIGAGIAGAACAASLQQAGLAVKVFEKSRGAGGRMASRRLEWTSPAGQPMQATVDHGVQGFEARLPRFRAMVARARAAGVVAAWQLRAHATWPTVAPANLFVATPGMPALARHVLGDTPLATGQAVQRLHLGRQGWQVVLADGRTEGPFAQVMLALPPMQAASLLAGHHDQWADQLAAWPMNPCWALMAVGNDVDWPWDMAMPDRGPLAWVARNDRKPGRPAPEGLAVWSALASADWSRQHLDADSAEVQAALLAALERLLPAGPPVHWQHVAVHRWRYATSAQATPDRRGCWWDEQLGLGVCGDFLGGSGVEGAWRSGDELADTVAACLDELTAVPEPA
jgi:renalase